jgi:hypothetical protein
MSATLTEVESFRQIPPRCHCDWTVTCTTPGARWELREVFPGCPVHGEAAQKQG